MNFVEEMKWRGMIHDIMPGTEEQLQKEMTSAYIGFDPTACLLYTSPSPRDLSTSRMPSSA